MVSVVPKLSAELLRRSAHPLRFAEAVPVATRPAVRFRTAQTTTASAPSAACSATSNFPGPLRHEPQARPS